MVTKKIFLTVFVITSLGRLAGGSSDGKESACDAPQVQLLGWEDALKKGMATHPSRRRQWHLTPVLLPGKSQGQRSLVGCSPWGY